MQRGGYEMKKHDLPAMPFYVGDWKKAPEIRALSLAARGLWFEMLCLMWESTERGYLTINGHPMTTEVLARQVGFACNLLEGLLAELESFAVFSRREDGAIFCRKMIRDVELSDKRATSGAKGGVCSSKLRSKTQANYVANHIANTEDEDEDENEDEVKVLDKERDFEKFWKAYPKKEGKGYCRKIWAKLQPSKTLLDTILAAVEVQSKTQKWTKDGGQYIPMPSTWLNQSRWEDEVADPKSGIDRWYEKKLKEQEEEDTDAFA
jgi:hypothetical protein